MHTGQDNDKALMLRAKDGDQEGLRVLFGRYNADILNYFYRRLDGQRREIAEEYTQEVFLRIWRTKRRYRPVGTFRSYMFSIAINLWKDHLRKKENSVTFVPIHPVDTAEREGNLCPQIPDSKANNPHDALADRERRTLIEKAVSKAVNSLPEEQREVVLLKYYHGLSYFEISRAVGCPVRTAYSRRTLGLTKLAETLRALKVTLRRDYADAAPAEARPEFLQKAQAVPRATQRNTERSHG